MSDRRTRRNRRIVLLLLLAALSTPIAGASIGDPCCPGMETPCSGSPAPCASFSAAPCCDHVPSAVWPTQRSETGQPTGAAVARSALIASPLPALEIASAADLPAPAAALRLSVVLRN